MEQERIRDLLGKYFEGETSEEEELLLKELLNSSSLPDALKDEYGYLTDPPEKIPEPSQGFEERLAEVTHVSAAINPYRAGRRLSAMIGSAVAIAAGIWIISLIMREPYGKDTYSDPVIAMAEVKTILMNVSERMNTGTSQLREVADFAERPDELNGLTTINEVLGKNLSRLRYLGDLSPGENETETK